MKSILKLTLAASVAMIIATGCSKSNGSSSSDATPLPPIAASGKLVDGYLAGAFVFADCNGDKTFQANSEPSTITDAAGDFDLTIPDSCKFATLIASGGTNVDTGLPFSGVLMAPAGSRNITPLTTLVSIDPAFAAKIGAYGIPMDTDFVGTAIPADLLIISQQVVSAINLTATNTKISDTSALISSIVTPLVSSLGTIDFSDHNATATGLAVASKDSFLAIAANDPNIDVTNASVIKDAVTDTLNAITVEVNNAPDDGAGNVVLTDVATDVIKTAFDTSSGDIAVVVTLPIVHISGFVIGTDSEVTSTNNTYTATTNEGNITSTFTANVNVTDTKDNNYIVELTMAIVDTQSQRSATIAISNVVMTTLATSPGLLSIDPTQVLSATITGTDSNGDLFSAVQLSNGQLGDIMTSTGSAITINMASLLNKVNTTAGSSHPLGSFLIPGEYAVTVTATGGIPMNYLNYILSLTINPN